ncbi:hypothetical protein NKW43_15190 [Gluconobacter albidus]|uniref:hypothetical protein n=1 Tax=Gluconobacter albidus TaxID=318683 RepID=UPI00209E3A3A|nr:hypothetical protein [Gluconobacter albidus]MCP1275001.1 hypothetical protein [Gluconobacter albidus]
MSIRFRTSSAMLLAGMTLSSAALAAETSETSEKPCETDLCRSVRQSWTSVRQDASDATRWTKKAVYDVSQWGTDKTPDTAKTGQDQ